MTNKPFIDELWSLKINPSDLYNIERVPSDKPKSGGGHTYIQVPKGQVPNLLKFLHSPYPDNGKKLTLLVGNQRRPNDKPEELEFWSKSAGRMRIANQNRKSQSRLSAWTPQYGFPKLEPYEGSDVAKILLNDIGQLHIYLMRLSDGSVWAGYTKGEPSKEDLEQPFSDLLYGNTKGGYWCYKEDTE